MTSSTSKCGTGATRRGLRARVSCGTPGSRSGARFIGGTACMPDCRRAGVAEIPDAEDLARGLLLQAMDRWGIEPPNW